ncbi:MAG: IclR family transcriptional regulator, partial [Sutterella sp.]|nr:IclR family transcriptional regulator [Sutterella sp.]
MAADKDSDIKTVQVLDRAVKILDVVATGSDPVNSNRIVQETGIHASTAHRLLWSLTELGFLEHTTENCWRLGLRFLEYGNRVRRALPVRTAAVDVMRSLYEKTQLTVNLSMRSADSIM